VLEFWELHASCHEPAIVLCLRYDPRSPSCHRPFRLVAASKCPKRSRRRSQSEPGLQALRSTQTLRSTPANGRRGHKSEAPAGPSHISAYSTLPSHAAQSLDALPVEEREAVNAVWSNFSSSSHRRRATILQGLLTMCCFSQLSLLTEQLAHLIRIDPFVILPREIALKILGYLDATSLCRAAQVTRRWRSLADDDFLWRGICEQHIGQKCRKCGWGLPVLENKRNFCRQSDSPSPPPTLPLLPLKRCRTDTTDLLIPPLKRQRLALPLPPHPHPLSTPSILMPPDADSSFSLLASSPFHTPAESLTRPWKDVYSERMTIERNWRRGRCTVRTLEGHTDGIMCLQFNETLSHPAFPVLITGSYDRTVRVWNLETGVELHCLKGHERAVRALQFDEAKLITGSMDRTLKVWDWRSGKCIRTLTGHSEGVVSLNFDSNVLASGSVDSTIKVWNLRTGGAFTLRGHSDWVNAVQLWDSNGPTRPSSTDVSLLDVSGVLSPNSSSGSEIDAGKMLFSASDDGTIKMWDLTSRMCVRTITGHVAQVQSMKLLFASDCSDELSEASLQRATSSSPPSAISGSSKKPLLISGSLDNTIKLWDIETGKSVQTFFGHIEGVWAVASDKLRLVSGSHDRTIKVC
jgi:F-box/WD-40 domain protein MET30